MTSSAKAKPLRGWSAPAASSSGLAANLNFNRQYNAYLVRILPGETYVTGVSDHMIVTVLGSCVSACIRNPVTGFGGMNHFMLPESDNGEWNGVSASSRYGNFAMEALINEVLKSGCTRRNLEVKIFGGSDMIGAGGGRVGRKNVEFALRYFDAEGIRVVAADTGGIWGRRIHYVPATGVVNRMLLKDKADTTIAEQERHYASGLASAPVEGDVQFFD